MKITILILALSWVGLFAQNERWVYEYNGPANGDDRAQTLCYGADGYVYAAGTVTGNDGYLDFTVIKLSADSAQKWIYRYQPGNNGNDYAYSIIYGTDGNLYVAGLTREAGYYNRFSVISLDTAGNQRWACVTGGTLSDNQANSVTMGADGNIYAAGALTINAGSGSDFAVISIDTAGNERWVYTCSGPGNSSDAARSVTYGADGCVYAAGTCYSGSTLNDFRIVKLTAEGDSCWSYQYNGPNNHNDDANKIIYGTDANLYICGISFGGSATYHDIKIISVDTAGNERWVYTYDGPFHYTDGAVEITEGAGDNIYIGGWATADSSISANPDWAILNLDRAGNEDWVYIYHGYGVAGGCNALAYGPDDNLYAGGYAYGPGVSADFCVMSLDTTGAQRWVYFHDGPAHSSDYASDLVLGGDNNLYQSGYHEVSGSAFNFAVLSLGTDIGIQEQHPVLKLDKPITATLFSDRIKLSLNNQVGSPVIINLYDITGRKVYYKKITEPGHKLVLNDNKISEFRPGIYFITVQIDGCTIINNKIIKIQ